MMLDTPSLLDSVMNQSNMMKIEVECENCGTMISLVRERFEGHIIIPCSGCRLVLVCDVTLAVQETG